MGFQTRFIQPDRKGLKPTNPSPKGRFWGTVQMHGYFVIVHEFVNNGLERVDESLAFVIKTDRPEKRLC